ncbi:MAG: hypothetical protein NVSMB3_06780 [Acidobacteriaceae bacterium]
MAGSGGYSSFSQRRAAAVRRTAIYLGLMLITVAAGLFIRFVPLGLPWFFM